MDPLAEGALAYQQIILMCLGMALGYGFMVFGGNR